jgi:hypothetical protein
MGEPLSKKTMKTPKTWKNLKKTIAELNDQHRKNIPITKTYLSRQVSHLPPEQLLELFQLVRSCNNFNQNNDPYAEHDFGKVQLNGKSYFWKIDYYDPSFEYASADPANPEITNRVLSIMEASEW